VHPTPASPATIPTNHTRFIVTPPVDAPQIVAAHFH
jgi:hypothetical protein